MLTKDLRVVALISGGKDSCYNMIQCVSEGHTIVALANLRPKDKDETDSYMFQTVGHHMIGLYGQALGVPLYRRTLEGGSVELGADYSTTKDDEVEDLYALLKEVKEREGVNAVSVGAILSDYQRVRVEHVCMRLELTPLAYLWRRDQAELLVEMVGAGVESILIKVAAMGLEPHKHLGKTLAQILPHMVDMESKFGLNVCGEGGEYETFTLDCPLFTKRIVIDKQELVIHSDDAFSPVGYLNILEAHLEEKPTIISDAGLNKLQIQRSSDLVKELLPDGPHNEFNFTSTEEVTTDAHASEHTLTPDSYIQVSCAPSGHFWVTGIMGWITQGQCVKVMTTKAMDALAERLASIDVELKDVAVMHLYVKNMDEFASINQSYKKYFTLNPPARLCVQVKLPSNVGLRIACYGYRPLGDAGVKLSRRTMHVQGLSHWAPANIGPYSQAVMLGDTTYVAGQIGMVPSTLDLVPGVVAQCRLSLRHVARVLSALSPASRLYHIIVGVCYITQPLDIAVAATQFNTALTESLGEEGCDVALNSRLLPDMQYVVVPRLPKGALVEWQVYAASCEGIITGHVERRSASLGATLHYKYLPTPYCLLSYTITIDRHAGTMTDTVSYQDALQLVYDTLLAVRDELPTSSCMEDVNHALSRCVQIFYMQGEVSENQLRKCFQSIPSSRLVLPPPVFIPVVAFTSDSRVMTLCC